MRQPIEQPADLAAAGPATQSSEPSLPARRPQPVDQTLDTGLSLVFRVQPDDAFFLLDGRLIGRVRDYASGAGFVLPDRGDYELVLRKGGFKDYRLRLRADGSRTGSSAVVARLESIPAAQVELGDLPQYRVREAVAFRVKPANARLLVDGKLRGPAIRFAGRRGRPGEWLRLGRGIHRLSFVAPGYRRLDIAVDFTAGATEEKQRITLQLTPE